MPVFVVGSFVAELAAGLAVVAEPAEPAAGLVAGLVAVERSAVDLAVDSVVLVLALVGLAEHFAELLPGSAPEGSPCEIAAAFEVVVDLVHLVGCPDLAG